MIVEDSLLGFDEVFNILGNQYMIAFCWYVQSRQASGIEMYFKGPVSDIFCWAIKSRPATRSEMYFKDLYLIPFCWFV